MKMIRLLPHAPSAILAAGLALASAVPLRAASVTWIEAERFDDPGGWTIDTQFIDQMGSAYLLADGLGTPVTDAVTRVELPAPGRRRLWVRARDWVPEHHPGRFRVMLDGRDASREFGASGRAGWTWEDGGAHDVGRTVELRLHDLSGTYGRCDAVVLAEDLDWKPPTDRAAIDALRLAHGGVGAAIRDAGDYDVVVVGGGLAGCMAAVASARTGARTALVQNRAVLGGNGSTEILVPPVGVWPRGRDDRREPRDTGIIEEAGLAGAQGDADTRHWSARLRRIADATPDLSLFLETHVTGVGLATNAAGAIREVRAIGTRTGARSRFGAKVFVDCTGDGAVGVAAGAIHRHGREARSMYGESMAPEEPNATTMGNSLKFAARKTDAPQPFATPPWATEFALCDHFPEGRHPASPNPPLGWQWMIELGGLQNTYLEKEEIRDDLLRLVYGIWSHIKNECPKLREEAVPYRLQWVGAVTGMRESRRLIGDHVLTENDIAGQVLFPDRVAFGGWGLDDHFSDGFFTRGQPARHPHKGLLHSVPFRSLYSTNVPNLLMAGRNISASHVGMGSTRVMMTCAVIGQAAGTAAALCAERGLTPRDLGRSHVEDLQQQILKDGAHIIGLPNTDPRDLARAATATASSEGVEPTGERMAAAHALDGFARAAGGAGHAWRADATRPGPHWLQLAWNAPRTFNCVHVTFQTRDLAPAGFRIEAPEGDGWRTLADIRSRHRRHVVPLDRVTAARLRIVPSFAAGICEVRVYDEPARTLDIARRIAATRDLPSTPDERWPWETPEEAARAAAAVPAMRAGLDSETVAKKYGAIVMDDGVAGLTGRWTASAHSSPYIGLGYLNDGDEEKGAKKAVFHPQLPGPGRYEIRLAYTTLGNRASNTPVTIFTTSGPRTVRVNQRKAPAIDGLLHSLGVFDLAAGPEARIEVSNGDTDGYVVVDALLLIPAP